MSDNKPYNLQLLWEATNGGLDYFFEVYPDAVGKENKSKHFKTHNENTPSSTIGNKKSKEGVYTVYNHASKESCNMVDHVMKERNLTFIEACDFLFSKYGLSKSQAAIVKPITNWNNDTTKPIGSYKLNVAKKHHDYKAVVPFLTDEIAKQYNFVSVESFEAIKGVGENKDKPTQLTVTATAEYPIYAYQFKDFSKIYEPKATKDQNGYSTKHHFLGTKPEKQIYGWDRLFSMVDLPMINMLLEDLKKAPSFKKNSLAEKIEDYKLDSVIICTGGSDGLNVASLGYNVIWFNSEAEIITKADLYELQKIAKVIYYIPDLDKTGVKQAATMGLLSEHHMDIKMLWLPESMKDNNKKDIADWVRSHKNVKLEVVQGLFKQMLTQAKEFKFWEWNDKRGTYTVNGNRLLMFLKHNGFHLYVDVLNSSDNKPKKEFTFIKINENIVQSVESNEIKAFVLKWLETHFIDLKIQEVVLKSIFFNEKNSLLQLPVANIDTRSGGVAHQWYYFTDSAVKVTSSKIEKFSYKTINNLVWEKAVINKPFDVQKPHFTIAKTEGNWTIDIHSKESKVFKVLINTSRVHWLKDADKDQDDTNEFNITSDKLSLEENLEQQQHLINKMYCIGFLLHKYNSPSKPYFVLGMDHAISESTADSSGGSGKSAIIKFAYPFVKNKKYKDGKEMPKENPQFAYDGVTAETELVFLDDLDRNQDLEILFGKTTSSLVANHKGGKIYTIDEEDLPKFAATTNFAPKNNSDSLERRLLDYQCSNYYHVANDKFEKTRKISDSFGGKNLQKSDYPANDWTNDLNFALQCLQFYLSQEEKVCAPATNKNIRIYQAKIGDEMRFHFDNYFENGANLNCCFLRDDIQNAYKDEVGKFSKSSQKHKAGLLDYCKMNNWKFIPQKKKWVTNTLNGIPKSVEQYYIQTIGVPVVEETPEPTENNLFETEIVDPDMPF